MISFFASYPPGIWCWGRWIFHANSKIFSSLLPFPSDGGKFTPLDFIPSDYPKDKLLKKLKYQKEQLKVILNKMDFKIEKLEAKLSK